MRGGTLRRALRGGQQGGAAEDVGVEPLLHLGVLDQRGPVRSNFELPQNSCCFGKPKIMSRVLIRLPITSEEHA